MNIQRKHEGDRATLIAHVALKIDPTGPVGDGSQSAQKASTITGSRE